MMDHPSALGSKGWPFALQEICSFLKGSSEALESPGGKLTLEAYLEVYHQLSPLLQSCSVNSLALQAVTL